MTISDRRAHDFAARLRTAERNGSAMPLASETFTELDWNDARRIAVARDELRPADGDECIGYKLGWTSSAMRNAFGIERPNWGTLWRSQPIDRQLDLSRLRHAKVEPEIVYTARSELSGTDVTAHDVLDSALGWAIGIKVVHPRWPSYDFTWLDNTADNSSAAAVAVGPVCQLLVELPAVEISFSNGQETRTGRSDQALDPPAEAVAFGSFASSQSKADRSTLRRSSSRAAHSAVRRFERLPLPRPILRPRHGGSRHRRKCSIEDVGKARAPPSRTPVVTITSLISVMATHLQPITGQEPQAQRATFGGCASERAAIPMIPDTSATAAL